MMLSVVEVYDERDMELPQFSSIQDHHRYSLNIVSDVCVTCRLVVVVGLRFFSVLAFGLEN